MKEVIRPYLTEEVIKNRVAELGAQISKDYEGKSLFLIGILKGSVVFMSDLMRHIDNERMTIDFMVVSSYGNGTQSKGFVRILKDLSVDIEGRDVLIVEDILDSGNTLYKLGEVLATRNPASLRICTLLDKPSRRVAPVETAYSGFEIEDEFVVGYGLDYDERYRHLPYIGQVSFVEE